MSVLDRINPKWLTERAILACSFAALALVLFALAEHFGIDSTQWVEQAARPTAAVLCVVLLAADVVLPTPSTVLMIALGNILGFAAGALTSLLGISISAVCAFQIDRHARPLLHAGVPVRAADLLARWGLIAIAIRPHPDIRRDRSRDGRHDQNEVWRFLIGRDVAKCSLRVGAGRNRIQPAHRVALRSFGRRGSHLSLRTGTPCFVAKVWPRPPLSTNATNVNRFENSSFKSSA